MNKIKTIAFYLPQYHPIPENNEFWGKGFTEWTNVAKAKSLFKGHKQPKVPADLGFYDLRVPESRIAQAKLAEDYHVTGFAYWHYWFGNGKRVLERPLNEVYSSGEPDFPFCIAWANQSWTGRWHGLNEDIILEQKYLGERDDTYHFQSILPLLKDRRYIHYKGRPLVILYNPKEHPYLNDFTTLWKNLAKNSGLPEIYFLGVLKSENQLPEGLDGGIFHENFFSYPDLGVVDRVIRKITGKRISVLVNKIWYGMEVHDYLKVINKCNNSRLPENIFPTILTGWDNTPRSGKRGVVLNNYSPDTFRAHVLRVKRQLESSHGSETLCFIKSWNEWAEGNFLEPDQEYGHGFLEIIRDNF